MLSIHKICKPSVDIAEIEKWVKTQGLRWDRTDGASSSEELVEAAGRVCYMSFGRGPNGPQSPKSNAEYIKHLVKQGHESVLEHVNWTFLISGVSRAFTHQLVRHRPGFAYSQMSQQYHDESDAAFVQPARLENCPKALEIWRSAVDASRRAYAEMLAVLSDYEKQGAAKESKETRRAIRSAARSVLPNATETKIMVTANARALRHFMTVRGAIVGDFEMRLVSAAFLSLLSEDAPSVFADFETTIHEDGLPIVRKHRQHLERGEV